MMRAFGGVLAVAVCLSAVPAFAENPWVELRDGPVKPYQEISHIVRSAEFPPSATTSGRILLVVKAAMTLNRVAVLIESDQYGQTYEVRDFPLAYSCLAEGAKIELARDHGALYAVVDGQKSVGIDEKENVSLRLRLTDNMGYPIPPRVAAE